MIFNKKLTLADLLYYFVFFLAIVLGVALTVSIFCILINLMANTTLTISIKGWWFFLYRFRHYSWLFEVTILVLTAVVALMAYRGNCKVNEVKLLLDIRQQLNRPEHREIHQLLETTTSTDSDSSIMNYLNENRMALYNYLGTLEVLNILLKNGVITKDNFRNQFGYRLENVDNCLPLMQHLKNEREYWKDLFELIEITNSKK
ncbi:MAG: hypothetical protein ACI392_03675 [Paludibacteraceae bacterium]